TGDTLWHNTPVPVSGGLHFAQLATHGQSACGITGAGAAYCWGWGWFGENGDSTGGNVLAPRLVSSALQFTTISSSLYSACGVTAGHAGIAGERTTTASLVL